MLVPLGALMRNRVSPVFSGVLTGNDVIRRGSLGCAHAQLEVGVSRFFFFFFSFSFSIFFSFPGDSLIVRFYNICCELSIYSDVS